MIFQSAQSWRRDASGACDVSRRGHALNPRAQKQKTNKFLSHLIACLPFCLFVSNSSAFLMIRAPQRNTLASHQSNGRLDDKGNKQMKKKNLENSPDLINKSNRLSKILQTVQKKKIPFKRPQLSDVFVKPETASVRFEECNNHIGLRSFMRPNLNYQMI